MYGLWEGELLGMYKEIIHYNLKRCGALWMKYAQYRISNDGIKICTVAWSNRIMGFWNVQF